MTGFGGCCWYSLAWYCVFLSVAIKGVVKIILLMEKRP